MVFGLLMSGMILSATAQENQHITQENQRKERVQGQGKAHFRTSKGAALKQQKRLKNKSAEEIAQVRTEQMDARLKFTDQQKKEVYALQLDAAKLRKKEMEVRKQQAKEYQEKLNSLLSEDQKTVWKESYKKEGRAGKKRSGTWRQGTESISNNS